MGQLKGDPRVLVWAAGAIPYGRPGEAGCSEYRGFRFGTFLSPGVQLETLSLRSRKVTGGTGWRGPGQSEPGQVSTLELGHRKGWPSSPGWGAPGAQSTPRAWGLESEC